MRFDGSSSTPTVLERKKNTLKFPGMPAAFSANHSAPEIAIERQIADNTGGPLLNSPAMGLEAQAHPRDVAVGIMQKTLVRHARAERRRARDRLHAVEVEVLVLGAEQNVAERPLIYHIVEPHAGKPAVIPGGAAQIQIRKHPEQREVARGSSGKYELAAKGTGIAPVNIGA